MFRWSRPLGLTLLALVFFTVDSDVLESATAGRPVWSAFADPSPLSAAEENSPAAAALARKHNPAMAFPTEDIWPTSVSYGWHDKKNLMARVVAKTGRVMREYVAVAGAALDGSWGDLPESDGAGDRVEYYTDGPGDDRVVGGKVAWLARWREIMAAPRNVTAAAYPPTQYAHVFWYNQAKGLLAVQYWFYYPYNLWINRHEGDWEHINVIFKGPRTLASPAAFKPVGVQFFFHGQMYEPRRVATTGANGNHVMVFTGGRSKLLFWEGSFSGGSYPFPAYYPGAGGHAGPLAPGDDTRDPERFIAAEDFKVVMLPEPDRVDPRRHPGLSWLRVPYYAGQNQVYGNPFVLDWLERGGAPQQPGRKKDWNARETSPHWSGTVKPAKSLRLPAGWTAQIRPMGLEAAKTEPALAANRR